jgi:hypothetical protein
MNMAGLPMPRGTWLVLVVAAIPMLVAEVVAAAPGYPVEDQQPDAFVVAYDETSHVLSLSPSTTMALDQPDEVEPSGPDGAPPPPSGGADDVVSGVVGGPNGQINHGQVIQQLRDLLDGQNPACLTSAVAQSDLGKGDHQVRSGDVETADSGTLTDELGSAIVNVDCTKNNPSDESGSAGVGKGSPSERPESAGKSDKAPRGPDKAPGRDK